MRGLILAAGRGRRLGSLGAERPKCLVPVGGRPLLDWQMEAFGRAGIGEIAIVRGFCGEQLHTTAHLIDNPRWETSNMVTSLAAAADWLALGDTIVSYADLVYPSRAIALLAAPQLPDVAVLYDPAWRALWERRFADPLSDAETFRLAADRRTVLEIGARATDVGEIKGQYMGLLRLTPTGSARILREHAAMESAARDRLDMTGMLRRLLAAGDAVGAVPYDSWWCEIDTPEDVEVAEEILRREQPT